MTRTAVLNSTAIELITDALDILTVADANQPLSAEDQATGLRVFNQMIKLWQAQGKHLWSLTEAVIPLEKGVNAYTLGPGGSNVANLSDFISTTLAADAAMSATTITLSSVAGMLGAANTLASDPADSTTGWATTGSTIASDGDILTLTNSGAASGYADYTLTTEFGETYIVDFEYTLGTSAGATFSIEDTIDAATLATLNLTATASGQLEFTATQNSHALRFKNDSTTVSEDSLIYSISFKVKDSGDKIG
ncbi:MAG: hypothetical protein CL867_09920, partial [Cytophagaceae bacterium]|nr:hypothetical protein [Cytophagaceae bacterium]